MLRAMVLISLALTACGFNEPVDPDDGSVVDCAPPTTVEPTGTYTNAYLPLQIGNRWTYREEPLPGLSGRVQTDSKEIIERAIVDGLQTFTMVSTQTVSQITKRFIWTVDGGDVRRTSAEDSAIGVVVETHDYEPGFLRFSEALAQVGDLISEKVTHNACDTTSGVCVSTTDTFTWLVEAVDEEITVPAGTFDCLRVSRLKRSIIGGQCYVVSSKTYWYAPGVGKVHEQGPSNRELLLSFVVN